MGSRKRLLVCTMVAVVVTHVAARDARGESVVPDDLKVEATPSPSAPLAGFLHIVSPFHIKTDGGSELRLEPGYYLDATKFGRLDGELRRLQEREVRLAAENKSFRESAGGWSPGWKTLVGALIVGGATGWYLGQKF